MPLAALLGREPAELAGLGGFAPKVAAERTVLIGIRNLDERERQMVRASGVHVFTMKDIDRRGIAAVVEQALRDRVRRHRDGARLVRPRRLRPVDRARRGHAGQGRPRLPRGAHADGDDRRHAASSRRWISVEVNPILDVRNSTAILGTELALSALGQMIL